MWTYGDVVALLDDRLRDELIDGEHAVTPSPGTLPQLILWNVAASLAPCLRATPIGTALAAPFDIKLSTLTVMVPDLVYFTADRFSSRILQPRFRTPQRKTPILMAYGAEVAAPPCHRNNGGRVMRLGRRTAMILVSAFVAVPALAAAQEPVRDFSQLNTRLVPGDTVWVTDAQGREVKGKVQALAPDALTLRGDGARTFAGRDVSLIRQRRPDGIWNGALIGLAVGGGIATAGCIAIAGEDDAGAWCAMGLIAYGVFGTGIGIAIDAMIPGKKIVAYSAPGAAGAPSARLSFVPFVTPRAKGVAVSFAF